MKRIETRHNEFVEHFKTMLSNSFPPPLKYKVEYFVGEEKGTRGLYFGLTSKVFGGLYNRWEEVLPHETIADIEDEFIDKVINDLVLAGITFLNVEAHGEQSNARVGKEISKRPFRNTVPRKMLFVN